MKRPQIFSQCGSDGRSRPSGIFSKFLQRAAELPTLLVFGGSQGAHAINQAMIRCLPSLQRKIPGIHIIHQTGERDYNDALAAYHRSGDFGGGFSNLLKTCRHFRARRFNGVPSGASTVAEIAAAGSPRFLCRFRAPPMIIRCECRALERAGAAVVVEESKLEASMAGGNDRRVASAILADCRE